MKVDTRLPRSGAWALTIPGISNVTVPAATGSGPTFGNVVQYRWPGRFKLAAFGIVPRSGLPADLAALSFAMLDDTGNQLVSDGTSQLPLSSFGPCLAFIGRGGLRGLDTWDFAPRWQALGRIVRPGDLWQFQFANSGAVDVTPAVAFRLEQIVEGQ